MPSCKLLLTTHLGFDSLLERLTELRETQILVHYRGYNKGYIFLLLCFIALQKSELMLCLGPEGADDYF